MKMTGGNQATQFGSAGDKRNAIFQYHDPHHQQSLDFATRAGGG